MNITIIMLLLLAGSIAMLLIIALFKKKDRISKKVMKPLSADYDSLAHELEQMQAQQANIKAMLGEYKMKLELFTATLSTWEKNIDAAIPGRDHSMEATETMQETEMFFNLQYLKLQSQMQNENRQYTMVSNIMKTKHDTVKNSISNVR